MTRNTILVTGGTGKTGGRLVEQLGRQGVAVRAASRSGRGDRGVVFDWSLPETFDAALADVRAIYLVAPSGVFDVLGAMEPFLRRALDARVERFVLLSSSGFEAGGAMMGAVHAWLRDHAPGWFVLRPSWFMQNFSTPPRLDAIRAENAIYSATGEGRTGFIDAADIAAVAARVLTAEDIENRDAVLTGPDAIDYDAVAALIATASGRPVRHRRLDAGALTKVFEAQGLPPDYAALLAEMDATIANGSEDRVTNEVQALTGRAPTGFAEFARREAQVWMA